MGPAGAQPYTSEFQAGLEYRSGLQPAQPYRTLKRILVIDDDTDVSSRLSAMGFEVISVWGGEVGLKVLTMTSVCGIVLNVDVPAAGAWAMLDQLHARDVHIPVMVMATNAGRLNLVRALENGATDYVITPVNHSLLSQKCARLFE